jgi:glutaredoxin
MKIELNKVYTLKLTNADEVVTKIVEDNTDHYVVENPLSAVPTARTLPQIFLDDNYIGGFTELKKHFEG